MLNLLIGLAFVSMLLFTIVSCLASYYHARMQAALDALERSEKGWSERSGSITEAHAKILLQQQRQIRRLLRERNSWQDIAKASVGIRDYRPLDSKEAAPNARQGLRGAVLSPREVNRRDQLRRQAEVEPPKMDAPTTVPPRVAEKFLSSVAGVAQSE